MTQKKYARPVTARARLEGRNPKYFSSILYHIFPPLFLETIPIFILNPKNVQPPFKIRKEKNHYFLEIRETARMTVSISASVLKAPKPNRIVPSGKVPMVWWAAGAQ